MTKHKEQRVGIFVDVQNMYYSAKQLYNSKVNFNTILSEGVAGRKLIRAMAYVIKADVGEESQFFDALTNIGFDLRVKDLQIFFGGAKKGDWDVGIAMDVTRMAGKLDTVVLVSGDGDFIDLLDYIKAVGCRAEVISFGKTTSSKLKDEADSFTDMDKNPRKFLIGRRGAASGSRKSPQRTAVQPKPAAGTESTPAVKDTQVTESKKAQGPPDLSKGTAPKPSLVPKQEPAAPKEKLTVPAKPPAPVKPSVDVKPAAAVNPNTAKPKPMVKKKTVIPKKAQNAKTRASKE